jgi:hypothetical protein
VAETKSQHTHTHSRAHSSTEPLKDEMIRSFQDLSLFSLRKSSKPATTHTQALPLATAHSSMHYYLSHMTQACATDKVE